MRKISLVSYSHKQMAQLESSFGNNPSAYFLVGNDCIVLSVAPREEVGLSPGIYTKSLKPAIKQAQQQNIATNANTIN
jgi:hypothetical protein